MEGDPPDDMELRIMRRRGGWAAVVFRDGLDSGEIAAENGYLMLMRKLSDLSQRVWAEARANQADRRVEIFERFEAGETRAALAKAFNLSHSRIAQLIIAEDHKRRLTAADNITADTPVEQCVLSARTVNGLLNAGVTTIKGSFEKSDAELLGTPNFGRKSLEELRALQASIQSKPENA